MVPPSKFLHSASLAPAPYAHACLVAAGARIVFAAGACPLDAEGSIVGVGDVEVQAAQALENLFVALADSGCSVDDVVRTTVYVASSERRDLVAAWQIVRQAFGRHEPPSTLLGVAALGYEDQLVEIDATAALPPRRPAGRVRRALRNRL